MRFSSDSAERLRLCASKHIGVRECDCDISLCGRFHPFAMLSHGPPILFSPYLNGNDTNNSNNNEKQWDSPGARLAHFALPSRAIGVRVILTPSSTWSSRSRLCASTRRAEMRIHRPCFCFVPCSSSSSSHSATKFSTSSSDTNISFLPNSEMPDKLYSRASGNPKLSVACVQRENGLCDSQSVNDKGDTTNRSYSHVLHE